MWSVAQSCLTLCDPMDCSPSGSSVPGVILARIQEWVAIPSFRGYSQPRDWTHVFCSPCIGRWFIYCWATWAASLSMCTYMEGYRPWGRKELDMTEQLTYGKVFIEYSAKTSPRRGLEGLMCVWVSCQRCGWAPSIAARGWDSWVKSPEDTQSLSLLASWEEACWGQGALGNVL